MKQYSAIIYIFIAVGIFFTFIDPMYNDVQALLDEKAENEELIEKANELRRKRQELTNKYNNISEEDRDKLLKVLPETVDNVRLILDVDNIAGKYGIVLRGINISGDINEEDNSRVVDRTSKKYGTISVDFSFSTTYETMKRFIDDLENSLRIVDIRELSVSASETSDIYNYSISLDTYWLR
jgi:Tfp pilus assembly protein PilO